jgi:hypothetical protein
MPLPPRMKSVPVPPNLSQRCSASLRANLLCHRILRCVWSPGMKANALIHGVLLVVSLGKNLALAQLRGHGGPVRTLPTSPDGQTATSGSFDLSTIWNRTLSSLSKLYSRSIPPKDVTCPNLKELFCLRNYVV